MWISINKFQFSLSPPPLYLSPSLLFPPLPMPSLSIPTTHPHFCFEQDSLCVSSVKSAMTQLLDCSCPDAVQLVYSDCVVCDDSSSSVSQASSHIHLEEVSLGCVADECCWNTISVLHDSKRHWLCAVSVTLLSLVTSHLQPAQTRSALWSCISNSSILCSFPMFCLWNKFRALWIWSLTCI